MHNAYSTIDPLSTNPLCQAALHYATILGWPVFPCKESVPLTQHGFKDATTDPERIRLWWWQHQDAQVAIATGARSKLLVVDIDKKDGRDGFASLRRLEAIYGSLPFTWSVRTPSGGRHFYFLYDGPPVKLSADLILPGIDIRCDGGYVIAPPSKRADGGTYEWVQP